MKAYNAGRDLRGLCLRTRLRFFRSPLGRFLEGWHRG